VKTGKQKYLSEKEFASLLSVIPDDRDYLLFYLIGNLGLRVGEGIRLRVQDIDFVNKCLHTPTLKRGRVRGVVKGSLPDGQLPEVYIDLPLDDLTIAMLQHYIQVYAPKNWLFPWKESHLPQRTARRLFKRYAAMAGLDPCYSVHSLRHYKGVTAYAALKDIRAVQLLLRHKSIASTQVYTEMDLEAKRKLFERVKPIT